MQPSVGIVLVNYNGMNFMPECLSTLAAIDYKNAQIVVVDNASSDGSLEWLKSNYPSISLICLPENKGVTGGNNAGLLWCFEKSMDYILLLNNDTVVTSDFLSSMMEYADPLTLVVPKILFYDRTDLINTTLGRFNLIRGKKDDWLYRKLDGPQFDSVITATMTNTCALLLSRELAVRVGMMDNNYFMYYDDIDYVYRASQLGAVVKYVPKAVIYHKESSSSGGKRISPFKRYYNYRNLFYMVFKHQKSLLKRMIFLVFVSVRMISLTVYHVLRGEFRNARAMWVGVADYFLGIRGIASPQRYS